MTVQHLIDSLIKNCNENDPSTLRVECLADQREYGVSHYNIYRIVRNDDLIQIKIE